MNERYLDRPWIRNPEMEWAQPQLDPEGLHSEDTINNSLEAMKAEATEIGLNKGVAFIVIWPSNLAYSFPRVAFRVVGSFERRPDPDKEGDLGTNYFGVAMSKLAEMLSTRKDSGSQTRPIRNGEVGYKGGITVTTEEGTGIFIGYSGGTEEQDVQIAYKGLTTLIQLAEE